MDEDLMAEDLGDGYTKGSPSSVLGWQQELG